MKNFWTTLGCIVAAIFIFCYGYNIGVSSGYDNAYEEGYNDCKNYGNIDDSDGYEAGYEAGQSDGYYDGATYTCLFFGDVDRAFQTALNGSSWFTFVDAYDKYVANIFDDNETKIDLRWSLISAATDNKVTPEEYTLLVSTFGEDLFLRNGITLAVDNS